MTEFIGSVVWNALPSSEDCLWDLEELKEQADKLHLFFKYPSPPSKKNLFKRVAKTLSIPIPVSDVNGDSEIVDNITFASGPSPLRRSVISSNVKQSYILLDDDGKVQVDGDYAWRHHIIQEFYNEMDRNEGMIDHLALRAMIRDFLENKLQGLWLKSGTYFVDNSKESEVYGLYQFCDYLAHDVKLDIVPMVDDTLRRKIVYDALENKSNTITEEFDEIVNSGNYSAVELKKLSGCYGRIESLLRYQATVLDVHAATWYDRAIEHFDTELDNNDIDHRLVKDKA